MTKQADYIAAIRGLPQPSVEQTIRFAWFVSAAHSWYKHLPIEKKVPFTFFLDPNAGRSVITTKTGERAVVEISPESRQFHYTWQTTEAYRRRFGLWNYFAPYGSAFAYASDGGVLHTARPLAHILDENGDWLSVTGAAHAAGTAHINAFVHANLSPRLLMEPDALRHGLEKDAGKARKVLRRQRREVAHRFRDAAESRVREVIQLCEVDQRWLWNDWRLFDEDWEPYLRSKGATDREVEVAFAVLQWRLIEETNPPLQAEGQFDLTTSANLERHRQITEMWQAMHRVIAIIYDGRQRTGFLSRFFKLGRIK